MNHEDYCSYELSKKLKEKGFDWECDYVYRNYGNSIEADYLHITCNLPILCDAPTLNKAQKWLRNKHRVHIIIMPNNDYGLDRTLYDFTLYHEVRGFESENRGFHYCSYEDCLTDAITKALELI